MNTQKGFAPILLILLGLVVIGGGLYFYTQNSNSNTDIFDNQIDTIATSSNTTVSDTTAPVQNKTSLSNEEFIFAVGERATKIMARGDINSDGYEDAIVEEIHCGGASCSVGLQIVFNEKNSTARFFEPTPYQNFEPSYKGSSARKSELTSVTIKDGIISLTGKGLACGFQDIFCQDEEWHMIRTVNYKFDGKELIQLSVNPPLRF